MPKRRTPLTKDEHILIARQFAEIKARLRQIEHMVESAYGVTDKSLKHLLAVSGVGGVGGHLTDAASGLDARYWHENHDNDSPYFRGNAGLGKDA